MQWIISHEQVSDRNRFAVCGFADIQHAQGHALMVTTVSIRLALRKLAEMTCGTAPSLIRVTARVEGSQRIYSAAIPWEYRDEVCSLLRERLDTEPHMQGSLLILTEEQAGAVLALAYRRHVRATDIPVNGAGDEGSEVGESTSQTV